MAQSKVVEYKSEHEMRHGIAHMVRHGWQVSATTERTMRRGVVARLMWLPWLATRKPHYLVTYTRQ